jgi:hypothetical protein
VDLTPKKRYIVHNPFDVELEADCVVSTNEQSVPFTVQMVSGIGRVNDRPITGSTTVNLKNGNEFDINILGRAVVRVVNHGKSKVRLTCQGELDFEEDGHM